MFDTEDRTTGLLPQSEWHELPRCITYLAAIWFEREAGEGFRFENRHAGRSERDEVGGGPEITCP